jgi:hypothetical protein
MLGLKMCCPYSGHGSWPFILCNLPGNSNIPVVVGLQQKFVSQACVQSTPVKLLEDAHPRNKEVLSSSSTMSLMGIVPSSTYTAAQLR